MNKDDLIKRFDGLAFQTDRKTTPYGDILVAERFVATGDLHQIGMTAKDFPYGAYQQWWVMCQGENVDAFGDVYFDAMHDIDMPLGSRKTARTNATLSAAEQFIDDNVKSGRYVRH